MKLIKNSAYIGVLGAGLLLTLHSQARSSIRITSTTNLIGDLVATLSENDFEHATLMGEGVDPHLYKATAADLKKLRQADLIFYNGLHLEGKLAEILERLGQRKPVIAVASYINQAEILTDQGAPDPHIWLQPFLWIQVAQGIATKLKELAPDKEKKIQSRLETLVTAIRQEAERGKNLLQKIPKSQRVLITSHDAFRYFGKFFDLEVFAAQGLSTESEAGLRDVQEILNLIRARKVRSIFVESSVPRATLERIEQSSSAKIGGELYSDSLGPRASPAGTYTGMLKHNLETIARGLQ